jgi:phosphate transport system permease protein
MALPYHLYVLATQHPSPEARGLQYAIALVLLTIVLAFNLLAFVIRQHYRKRYKW